MKGWDGDPAYWKVEGGALVGESTEANPVKQNTFLIYRGGEPADFELKVEFRINNTNSGVQYRSVQVPADEKTGKWVLKGYQADIDIANQFTGMLYEERGRGFLAPRGTLGYLSEGVRGTVGALESGDALKAYIKEKDWNQFHVIARGGTLIHILNGHVTAVFVDDDVKNRTLEGPAGLPDPRRPADEGGVQEYLFEDAVRHLGSGLAAPAGSSTDLRATLALKLLA